MRIRQVRPEFFTDPVTGHLAPAVQVTYIGLWCVADDAGWMDWDVPQLGALLYPYKSVLVREKLVNLAAVALSEQDRLVFYDCGCAWLPKLADHQKIGGNKAFTGRDRHRVHTSTDTSVVRVVPICKEKDGRHVVWQEVHTSTDLSARNGKVGKGNGTREADASGAASPFREKMAAAGLKPEVVS